MLTIRRYDPADAAALREVLIQAFGQPLEADLFAALVPSGDCIALTAAEDREPVGCILFSPVTIEADGKTHPAVGLAPMAVHPRLQRQGIGSQLVRAGLDACRQRGDEIVVVLGHPEYYPRFGFARASTYGIGCEYPSPDEAFMLVELRPGAAAGVHGTVRYSPEFKAF